MEIKKITPQGFCKGVVRAIAIINKALENDNIKKPIYMYGGLVHNKHIIDAYEKKGVIITTNIDEITSGTVIITAHGVSEAVIDTFKKRNLDIINATCFDVLRTHKIIKDMLKGGYDVVFYGKITHPETKGVLGISDKIWLVEKESDIDNLNITNNLIAFTTQTTMSYIDVKKILDKLILKYPQSKSFEDVCSATKDRQEALISQVKDVDLCIVVGDPSSNNTNKLKEICIKYTSTPCIMVENINDLKEYDLSTYKRIGITAGASTPTAIVNEIIEGLENNTFISKLKSDDYLKFK